MAAPDYDNMTEAELMAQLNNKSVPAGAPQASAAAPDYENMTEAQLQEALHGPQVKQAPTYSKTDAAIQGFGDPIGVLPHMQAAASYAGQMLLPKSMGGIDASPGQSDEDIKKQMPDYNNLLKYWQNRNKNIEDQHPLINSAGKVANNLALSGLIPSGEGATALARLAKGFGIGTLAGVAQNPDENGVGASPEDIAARKKIDPNSDDTSMSVADQLYNRSKQGIFGGLTGGFLQGLNEPMTAAGQAMKNQSILSLMGANAPQVTKILGSNTKFADDVMGNGRLGEIENFMNQEKLMRPGMSTPKLADKTQKIMDEEGPKINALHRQAQALAEAQQAAANPQSAMPRTVTGYDAPIIGRGHEVHANHFDPSELFNITHDTPLNEIPLKQQTPVIDPNATAGVGDLRPTDSSDAAVAARIGKSPAGDSLLKLPVGGNSHPTRINGNDLADEIVGSTANKFRTDVDYDDAMSAANKSTKRLRDLGDNISLPDLFSYRKSVDGKINWQRSPTAGAPPAEQQALINNRQIVQNKINNTLDAIDQGTGGNSPILAELRQRSARYGNAADLNTIASKAVGREGAKAMHGMGALGAVVGSGAAAGEYERTGDPISAGLAGLTAAGGMTLARKYASPLGYGVGNLMRMGSTPTVAGALGGNISPWLNMKNNNNSQ